MSEKNQRQLVDDEPERRRAPNPLIAISMGVVIIIAFVLVIFIVVSPALAP